VSKNTKIIFSSWETKQLLRVGCSLGKNTLIISNRRKIMTG